MPPTGSVKLRQMVSLSSPGPSKYLGEMKLPPAPAAERWVLAGTTLAASLVFIDGSALNVALPQIQAGLGATASDLLWIANAYLLVLAALIPLGGALGDRLGRRRVYLLGIAGFTLGSVLCGLAPSPQALIAARVFQGLGGALLIPGSLALLSSGTAPERRGRAIGVWSAVTTVVTILGPLVGGILCDAGLWRAVFFINLPLGVGALILVGTRVADEAVGAKRPMDGAGSLLLSLGLAAVTWGAQSAPDLGFTALLPWTAVAGGIVCLAAFVLVEARSPSPLIPLGMFRSGGFAGANVLTLFLYGALGAMGFFLSLNLVQVQGYPMTVAGMALLPFVLCMAVFSRRVGTWADRVGPRPFLTVGPLLVAAAFVCLALPGITGGWTQYFQTFFPGIVLFGLGMAVTVAPLSAAVMGSVPDEQAGTASGINNAVSRIGGVLTLALLGAVAVGLFPGLWAQHTQALSLTEEQRGGLAQQAVRMAGAVVPADWDPALRAAVHQSVGETFVAVWRVVLGSCAGLALLAAAAGWWGVPRKPKAVTGPGPGPSAAGPPSQTTRQS